MKPRTKKMLIVILVAALLIAAVTAVAYHRKKVREEYDSNLKLATGAMLAGAAKAEESCNLYLAVWHNAIWQTDDAQTDEFTHGANGAFYDDFNDALYTLTSDSSYQEGIAKLTENQAMVRDLMRALKNPPKGFEEAYDAIKAYYTAYSSLANIAVSPSGSYNSVSSAFSEADNAAFQTYQTMGLFIEFDEIFQQAFTDAS